MAITRRPINELLRNIAHELSDASLHGDLIELVNPLDDEDELPVAAAFVPLAAEAPYYEVVLGDDEGSGDTARTGRVVVEVHLVHSVMSDEQGSGALIGFGNVSGIVDLNEAVEEALLRPGAPYPDSTPYDDDPYTPIPEVRAVWRRRTRRPETLTDPQVDAGIFYRTVLEFVYHLEKGTVGA